MKTHLLNYLRIIWLVFAFSGLQATAQSQSNSPPRTAKLLDTAGSESKVSALEVQADQKFGIDRNDHDYSPIIVITKNAEFAIPLRSVSLVEFAGGKQRTVKFMTKAGEASVSGELPEGLSVSGTSDFGAFSLPLAKIKRLEFQQPGTIASPAHLDEFSEVDHHWLTSPGYDAILTLTDGTTMQVSHLRRHAKYHVSGNNVIGIGGSADHDVDFDAIDFRFIQGETSQKIRFDSVKTVEFSSNDSVTITTKSGAQAAMKFSPKDEERLDGFNGWCNNGHFYIQPRFVKSITFGEETK